MHGNSFIDTNIWIYAHLRKPNDPRHSIALQIVETVTDGVISPQVAAEYYSVMLRSGQSDAWIQENLHKMIEYFSVQPLNEVDVSSPHVGPVCLDARTMSYY